MNNQKIIGYLTLIIMVFCFNCLNAQKTRGVLHFIDGTTQSGFVKIIGIKEVKFKSTKKEKATFYPMMQMEKVVIHYLESSSTYVLRETNSGSFRVMKELEVGKVNLYTIETHTSSAPIYTGGAGGGWTGGGFSYQINNLYVQKEGEIKVTHLGSTGLFSKNFKKAASEYFKDCPDLTEKIMNKEFKKRDIRTIVKYYNESCNPLSK